MAPVAIQTNCAPAGCGAEVKLLAADVELRVSPSLYVSGLAGSEHPGRYSFSCPLCGSRVTKEADLRAIRLLTSAGVEPQADDAPAEVVASACRRSAIEFGLALEAGCGP